MASTTQHHLLHAADLPECFRDPRTLEQVTETRLTLFGLPVTAESLVHGGTGMRRVGEALADSLQEVTTVLSDVAEGRYQQAHDLFLTVGAAAHQLSQVSSAFAAATKFRPNPAQWVADLSSDLAVGSNAVIALRDVAFRATRTSEAQESELASVRHDCGLFVHFLSKLIRTANPEHKGRPQESALGPSETRVLSELTTPPRRATAA